MIDTRVSSCLNRNACLVSCISYFAGEGQENTDLSACGGFTSLTLKNLLPLCFLRKQKQGGGIRRPVVAAQVETIGQNVRIATRLGGGSPSRSGKGLAIDAGLYAYGVCCN